MKKLALLLFLATTTYVQASEVHVITTEPTFLVNAIGQTATQVVIPLIAGTTVGCYCAESCIESHFKPHLRTPKLPRRFSDDQRCCDKAYVGCLGATNVAGSAACTVTGHPIIAALWSCGCGAFLRCALVNE